MVAIAHVPTSRSAAKVEYLGRTIRGNEKVYRLPIGLTARYDRAAQMFYIYAAQLIRPAKKG